MHESSDRAGHQPQHNGSSESRACRSCQFGPDSSSVASRPGRVPSLNLTDSGSAELISHEAQTVGMFCLPVRPASGKKNREKGRLPVQGICLHFTECRHYDTTNHETDLTRIFRKPRLCDRLSLADWRLGGNLVGFSH